MDPSLSEEMKRTTVLKTVILPLPPRDIIALGRQYFSDQGYRALPASTPNNLMVRGGREGNLPSVIGEIAVQTKQTARGRTSVVSLSGYGERLSQHVEAFYQVLRAERQRASAATKPATAAPVTTDGVDADDAEDDANG
jgi:hypothetical protein